jgi:hypothetical protein
MQIQYLEKDSGKHEHVVQYINEIMEISFSNSTIFLGLENGEKYFLYIDDIKSFLIT